jgi:hypothetical protein
MRRPPASPRYALLPRFACRDDVVDVLWSPKTNSDRPPPGTDLHEKSDELIGVKCDSSCLPRTRRKLH